MKRTRMYEGTAKKVEKIRRLIARGFNQYEVAAKMGLHQTTVSRLCLTYGIPTSRNSGPKKDARWYTLPPIDPEKAARITADKQAFWKQQEKSA